VHLVAGQSVARAEAANVGQYLILESTTALEVSLGRPDIGEELANHGADRRVLLSCPDPGATIDVVWE